MPQNHSPRLTVGIISAGSVGLALAEAFSRAGHTVHSVYAHSPASAGRASERVPQIPQRTLEETAHAGLVVLAVPDPQLPAVIEQVAEHTQSGQIVAHTSGSRGIGVLQPVTDTGALPLALHPAMTFTGDSHDTDRLDGCGWGVTADSEEGYAVAEVLIATLNGVAVPVPEQQRTVYHAALAHAANHQVTLLSDAQRIMDHVLAREEGTPVGGAPEDPRSALLLRKTAHAAVDNALASRLDGLTGPVAMDDARTVEMHLEGLARVGYGEAAYLAMAERTAQLVGAGRVEQLLNRLIVEHRSR